MRVFFQIATLVCLSFLSMVAVSKNYLSQKDFVQQVTHSSDSIESKTLWLDKALQKKIIPILGHSYPKIRIRYKKNQSQTIWFLDKIGKERPISFGVSVKDNRVDAIKVLAFRESLGGEIRFKAFTEQFNHVGLTSENRLNLNIDGITGATMSVNAMKKITRLALMLAKIVANESNTEKTQKE